MTGRFIEGKASRELRRGGLLKGLSYLILCFTVIFIQTELLLTNI